MSDHFPLISVVVPVYNTEKYVECCLRSLSEQSEKNIEIIVVDDGSTDNSGKICDEWAKKDTRIRVIHQKNAGVVEACRAGFNVANGLYFAKVDSDDWVDNDFCAVLGNTAIQNRLDMIISGYHSQRNKKTFTTQFKKNYIDSGHNLIAEHGHVHTSGDIQYSWRMIFNMNFMKNNNLFFGKGMKIGEDTVLNITALSAAKRVMAIDYAGYHYRDDNIGSTMQQKHKPSLEHDLSVQFEIRSKYFSDIPSYSDDLARYYFPGWFYGIINNCLSSPNGLKFKDINRILNTNWVKFSFRKIGYKLPSSSKNEYIFALIAKFRISPLLYLYYKIKG